MRPAHHIALALALVLALAGCGRSFHVTAVKPTGGPGSAIESAPVAAVLFDIDRRIDGKKREILEQNQAPAKMATALMQSFQSIGSAAPGGEGLTLNTLSGRTRRSRGFGWASRRGLGGPPAMRARGVHRCPPTERRQPRWPSVRDLSTLARDGLDSRPAPHQADSTSSIRGRAESAPRRPL